MVNVVAVVRAGLFKVLGLLPTADRTARAAMRNPGWPRRGQGLRIHLRTALTAGFLMACGGLLAVIALRGYTIYG
jgi:hypothetical protein